LVRAKFWFAT
jgi:hypothetical protein